MSGDSLQNGEGEEGGVTAPVTHLKPSQLGTKEYWDALYTTELTNHAANPSDEGTVWFDDSDAEAKMVALLDEEVEADLGLDRETASVLDLGCGNGSLLFALRDDGWTGRLLGVDYSEKSVALARRIARTRAAQEKADEEEEEDGEKREETSRQERTEQQKEQDDDESEAAYGVQFQAWDVLNGSYADVPASLSEPSPGWDLVLDKGTFDAISLSGERDSQGRRICEGYGSRVLHLLRPGGAFLVTSCNWTEAELKDWFDGKREKTGENETSVLKQIARVEYPSFSFGGVKGQTISTLCFVKEVVEA